MKARIRGLVQRSVEQLPINGGYAEGISSIRLGSNAGSVRGKAEQFVLPGPYGRQICEASDAQAELQSAFDGRFDETGREEGKRDRHVYFADAAVLSSRNSDFRKWMVKIPLQTWLVTPPPAGEVVALGGASPSMGWRDRLLAE
jgi:hypothetical protein